MSTVQIVFSLGGLIYVLLGLFHGVLALRDVSRPKTFTPIDDSVREAMTGVPMALHPATDMWRGWLGFNLSHSLGLILFGGIVTAVALFGTDLIGSWAIGATVVLISGAYLALSIKFWFSGPVLGTGIATLCFVVGALLS